MTSPSSNDEVKNRLPPKLHAIQLIAVQITELSIRVTADPSTLNQFEEGFVQLQTAHTPYNEADKTVQVRVRAEVPEDKGLPVSLHVEVVGAFQVDEDKFDKQYVEAWAKSNAPLVLYPFLREQVFSLTVRVGMQGLLIPLMEVPSFKVVAPAPQT